MLDTGVAIHIQRRTPSYVQRFAALDAGSCVLSVLSLIELRAGLLVRPGREREEIMRLFLASVPVLPLDAVAAERAAQVRARLHTLGRRAGDFDEAIAGHAWQAGLTLVVCDSDLVSVKDVLPEVHCEVWSPPDSSAPKKKRTK